MSGIDYKKCNHCYKKLFYDVEVNYGEAALVAALCHECATSYKFTLEKRTKIERAEWKRNHPKQEEYNKYTNFPDGTPS